MLSIRYDTQISLFNTLGIEETQEALINLINVALVLSKKYDVVVTNPPYLGSSAMNSNLVEFGKKYYPNSKSDLFAMFIEWGNKKVKYNGCNAMVTMQSWMFLKSYNDMRVNILKRFSISNLMYMENMVLGIAFGTAATLFWNRGNRHFKGTYNYVKYTDIVDDKPLVFPDRKFKFSEVNQELFTKISGSPIAFWAKKEMVKAFIKGVPLGKQTIVRNGMKTGDNDRFLRCWWEIDNSNLNVSAKNSAEAIDSKKKWFPYNKGGESRRWYGNNNFVVNWENGGKEIFYNAKKDGRNVQDYPMDIKFSPSVSWSLISSRTPAFRYKVSNLTDINGMSFYNAKEKIHYYLGFCNTAIALEFLEILNPSAASQAGDIARLPIILNEKYESRVNALVKDNIQIAKTDWDSFEISWDFKRNPLIRKYSTISLAYEEWKQESELLFNRMKYNEEEINKIFNEIYNLDGVVKSEIHDNDVTLRKANVNQDIKEFISYLVGCMLGRYSLDVDEVIHAGGNFDVTEYLSFIPSKNNVILITDNDYFSDDIVNKFIMLIEICYGKESLEDNLTFIASALDGKSTSPRETIRNYFLKDLFNDHCSRYSVRGAGKCPIYWLYDSGKQNGFKALIYMQRYDENTTGQVRVDYLHRVQQVYERTISNLQENITNSDDAKEITQLQKQIEKLTKQLKECKEYDERLGHMALERVPIGLDDGVKVNYQKIQTDSKGKFYQILAEI